MDDDYRIYNLTVISCTGSPTTTQVQGSWKNAVRRTQALINESMSPQNLNPPAVAAYIYDCHANELRSYRVAPNGQMIAV